MNIGKVSAEGFLERSHEYFAALEILQEHFSATIIYPIGLVASQAIELALKAFLLHSGASESELKKIGHNLQGAWEACSKKGLGLGRSPSFSVQVLSLSHDSPYLFRYPQEKIAVALTQPDELLRDVKAIVDAVGVKLGR